MKTIFKYITILGLLIGVSSCSNYLDINTPVNDPSADAVTPDLIMAGAFARTYATQGTNMNRLGNVFMNNWSANVNSFTGGFNEEYQLIMTSNFYSFIWDQTYVRANNFNKIITSPFADYENHKAIGKIMKSFYMQYIVDLYGDCPYSQAFDEFNSTPGYDDSVAIYRDLIVQIDEAIDLINNNTVTTLPVGTEDIVYNGDMDSWIRFANTLKLRILMRQATLAETDSETATYLNQQFASLDENFITTSATVNPGYSNNTDAQNPFYALHGFDTAGNMTNTNNFTRCSLYAQEFLDGTLTGVADARINVLYAPIPGIGVVGVDQGIQSDDPAIPDDISGLGTGLIVDSTQDGYIFLAAESYFLQAEAAYRGYISGDAKAFFESGIMASFAHFGLNGSAYITATNGISPLNWDASSNKIEAIMTQKWIATNGINAIESWIDYVRTGYPDVPLAQSAQQPNKPNRLMYPTSELVGNSSNVPSQTSQDAFSTRIFWDTTN